MLKSILCAALLLGFAGSAHAAKKAKPAMSVEEQVGQLFMIAIDSTIAETYKDYIQTGRLGGALLRWDKFTGESARDFDGQMQQWAEMSPSKLPFLIATDHEGGPVFTQRMYGGTIFPGNMALGAARSAQWAEEAAEFSARELRELGIHVDFAPAVDVNSNPENPIIGVRSFGEDPKSVAVLSAAAVRGYMKGGVIAVAKHFPGHGDTHDDSHTGLPVIDKPLKQLLTVDLVPFKAAIEAEAPIVMTAHIVFTDVDPERPATLSSRVIQGMLRRQMGFGGIVVTDALDMGAIADKTGTPEGAVEALEAGCDLLLVGKADYTASFNKVVEAAKSGRIAPKRLQEAVGRVVRLKKRLAQSGAKKSAPADAKKAQALARKIAESSVTLLRNDERLLPLRLKPEQKIAVIAARSMRFDGELKRFVDALSSRHASLTYKFTGPEPSAKDGDEAVALSTQSDVVIAGTYSWGGLKPEPETQFINRLLETGKPVIVLSLMNPYDLRNYPAAKTMIATYGVTDASLEAAARLLFGEIKPKGRLPVTIPGLFSRGSGLKGF